MASKRTAASVLRNGPAYLVAFVAAIACLAAERAVEPMFVERSAFLMVMPALLIGAVLGGVGPALLVVVLGLIGNQILTNGSLTTNPANLISAITFSLLGVSCGGAAASSVSRSKG